MIKYSSVVTLHNVPYITDVEYGQSIIRFDQLFHDTIANYSILDPLQFTLDIEPRGGEFTLMFTEPVVNPNGIPIAIGILYAIAYAIFGDNANRE